MKDSNVQSAMVRQGTHMRQPAAWDVGAPGAFGEADIIGGSPDGAWPEQKLVAHGVYGKVSPEVKAGLEG
jgi:hypothetical protein